MGEAMLPAQFADPDDFGALQIGYRSHGHTGESLVSEAEGKWQPNWYVIAQNGLDDPFFIDASDAETGYPVLYARHGTGAWDAVEVAPSLRRFAEILSALKVAGESFLAILAEIVDLNNPFWAEVRTTHVEAQAESGAEAGATDYDPEDYRAGGLVVTDPGPQKLKVVQLVCKARGITLKDGLALAAGGEFLAASGMPIQLRRLQENLLALGAKVDFRVEDD